MSKERNLAIADALVSAVEACDFAQVRSLFAPDIVVKYNVFASELALDEAMAGMTRMRGMCTTFKYEDIERRVTDQGYVQMAAVTGVTDAGKPFRIDACVIADIGDDGKITAIKEYMDSVQAQQFLEP